MPPRDPGAPLALGSPLPDFSLTDVLTGQPVALRGVMQRGLVINFWSVDCAWSRYYDDYFIERANQWAGQGVPLLLVNSNVNETVEQMRDMADAYGIPGPILRDEGCALADALGAQTTPHLFVFNSQALLIYQGAVDDRSFRQPAPTVNYLDAAVQAVLAGQAPSPAETPAYGCTIVRLA